MIKHSVPLKELTNYKIGGPARYFLSVRSSDELIAGLREWEEIKKGLPEEARKRFVLGSGTNLLIDDRGFNGLVIYNQIMFIKRIGEDRVEFGSALLMSEAVEYCVEKSLCGFEWAGGLPGSVGGAIRGNAGAFGGEIKDNVFEVESFDLEKCDIIIRSNEKCNFDYRTSVFKTISKNELIIAGSFQFKIGDKTEINKQTQEKIDYRASKQPLDYPSAGSTFKNIPCDKAPKRLVETYKDSIKLEPLPVIPVARLLSDAGLRGERAGDAQISDKHPNFIINLGEATARDVLRLMNLAKNTVRKRFGVEIEPEIVFLEY